MENFLYIPSGLTNKAFCDIIDEKILFMKTGGASPSPTKDLLPVGERLGAPENERLSCAKTGEE